MNTIHLLPWNPDADVNPAKQAVLTLGLAGDAAYVGVTGYGHSHELTGGRLTLSDLDRLTRTIYELRAELIARGADSQE